MDPSKKPLHERWESNEPFDNLIGSTKGTVVRHFRDNTVIKKLKNKKREEDNYKLLQKQSAAVRELFPEILGVDSVEDGPEFIALSFCGENLNSVWPTLTPEQKTHYRDQIVKGICCVLHNL